MNAFSTLAWKRWVAAAAIVVVPITASAQSVSDVESELDTLDSEVSRLEADYLNPELLETSYDIEARYNDGRVAYFRDDYILAANLLVDVVGDSNFIASTDAREAMYLLADSLFQIRNYVAAQRYFDRVLEMGPGQYYEETAGRLLKIAYETGDFDRLDDLYARLQGGQMSAEIAYLAGKAFYERGDYQKARENFSRAAQTPEYALLAEYYRGVAYVAEKQLEEAKRIFTGIVNAPRPPETRGYEVIDLSWLALGRIAYEQADIELAIDHYSRLPRSSPQFDRALWEQTWVLVSRGNFEAARRNVDILQFLEDPDPDIAAEAKLLRADLSLKLGEYDTARADYQAVLDEFMPAKKQMDDFAAQHEDLSAFFAQMSRDQVMSFDSDYMPALVQEWIESDPEMRASARLLVDVREVERGIRDSEELLDRLTSQLSGSARSQSFPTLSEGVTRGFAVELRLLELRHALALEHYAAVSSKIKGGRQTRWDEILQGLDEVKLQVESVPELKEQAAQRERELRAELDRLEGNLEDAGFELDGLRAQLTAVESQLGRHRQAGDSETGRLESQKEELAKEVDELEEQRTVLQEEIATKRREGAAETSPSVEAEIQARYLEKLETAESFLDSVGSSPEVDAARSELQAVQAHVDAYQARLDAMVDQKVGGLRDDLEVERQLLADHRASMRQLVNASQSGAGVLAYLNFARARSEINEVVLRGDVGIIDVSWQKKEDVTERISGLFEDRTAELKLLQEAFEEVR